MKELVIVERNISELIPADYNPRQLSQKQYEDIKASLSEFGIVDPIIINMNPDRLNIVIGGHQRLRGWRDLKHKTIPCIELYLSLEKERELNIRLNKNTGEFDFDLLANNFDVNELVEFGFEEYELGIVEPVNSMDEWKDMPEFETIEDSLKIIFHFETEQDRIDFNDKFKFKFSQQQANTWSTWYPFKEIEDPKSLKYE